KPSPDCCRSLMTLSKRSGRRGRFWGWRLMLHQAWRSRHSVERLQLLTMAKRFSTMDPAAFAALVERCAPTTAMVRPLTAIVRQAGSFEPLLITIGGRKPIPIQATDRDEAIQLATEGIATGRQIRTGLAQLDAEETKQAGLTAATTFDACKHIAGLGRLFEVRLQSANMKSS